MGDGARLLCRRPVERCSDTRHVRIGDTPRKDRLRNPCATSDRLSIACNHSASPSSLRVSFWRIAAVPCSLAARSRSSERNRYQQHEVRHQYSERDSCRGHPFRDDSCDRSVGVRRGRLHRWPLCRPAPIRFGRWAHCGAPTYARHRACVGFPRSKTADRWVSRSGDGGTGV